MNIKIHKSTTRLPDRPRGKVAPLLERLQAFLAANVPWLKAEWPGGAWLAGGCIRSQIDSTDVDDMDFFFSSEEASDSFYYKLLNAGAEKKRECPEGKLINMDYAGIKIQLVKAEYYESPLDLISSFDITASQFAFDGDSLYTTTRAFSDAEKKRLAIDSVTFPAATLRRLVKYGAKGYKIGGRLLLDATEKIQNTPLDSENSRLYID